MEKGSSDPMFSRRPRQPAFFKVTHYHTLAIIDLTHQRSGGTIDPSKENAESMTLCIAAECWNDDIPCIALCCDTRAERGGVFHELVGSDDVDKIREVGSVSIL